MNYPVLSYAPAAIPAKSNNKKIIIIVAAVISTIIVLGLVGVGVGVGLGVGLSSSSDGSSSSSSSSSSSGSGSGTTTSSILEAPSVTCTYGGSDTCGCAATKPSFQSPKITNGYAAVTGSWPWSVAIYINNNRTFCSGFLVSYQHVITAAHCASAFTGSTFIFAGLNVLSARSSAQVRLVSKVVINPSYDATAITNDIAVVTLATPFDKASNVGKCCLPTDTSLPTSDERGVIAGWGYTTTNGPSLSDQLLQGVIKVQPASTCAASTAGDTRFCAGYSGVDACFGDSGSAFMTSVNNLWTCTGVVSSGRGCGVASFFMRTSAYQSFINENISG